MKKILLIEDNKDMRENTAEILVLSYYTVFTAKNGKEGISIAIKENPDLIICDIMMPVMDGYTVLNILSKNEITAAIPFVFLTAKAERSDLRKGMEMGADDYVTKPFDDSELLFAVEMRLKKNEIIRKEFSKNRNGMNDFIADIRAFENLKVISLKNEVKHYSKKQHIYMEGGFPKAIYLLSKGKIRTYKTNEEGKELITGLIKEGDFFGYLALLEEQEYKESATAMEDSEVCVISKDDFYSLIFRNAEVSKKFIKMISDNLEERETQLIKLAYNSVRKRVSDSLIVLQDRYKKDNEKIFRINISRENLASIAGTAVETTIRTLSDFKEEGLIEVSASNITILNLEKLKNLRN